MIFMNLNLLDLYNISFVCKDFNVFVRIFERYKQHFELSNKIISIKIWSSIIDKHFLNLHSRISDFEKHFKDFVISYFISNLKHDISITNVLAHMFFL